MENRRNSFLTSISTFFRSLRGKKRLVLAVLCASFSLALFGAVYSAIVADESVNKPLSRPMATTTQQTTCQNQPSQPNTAEKATPERIVRNNPFKDYEFPRQATIDPEIEEYRASEVECRECRGPITQNAEKLWEKAPAKREDQDAVTLPKKDVAQSKDENTASPDDARRNALMNIPDGFGPNGYQSNSVPRHSGQDYSVGNGGYGGYGGNGGYGSAPHYSSDHPTPRTSQPTTSSTPEHSYSVPQTQAQNESPGNRRMPYFPSQGIDNTMPSHENEKTAPKGKNEHKEDNVQEETKEKTENDGTNSGQTLNNENNGSPNEELTPVNFNNQIPEIKELEDLKQIDDTINKIKLIPNQNLQNRITEEVQENIESFKRQEGLTENDQILLQEAEEKLNAFKQSLVSVKEPGFMQQAFHNVMDYLNKNRFVVEIIRNMATATGTAFVGSLGSTLVFGTPFWPFFLTGVGGTLAAYLGWTSVKHFFGKKQEEELGDEDLEKIKFEEVKDKTGKQAEIVVQTIPTPEKTAMPTALTKASDKLVDAAYWAKSWIDFYLPKKSTT